MILALQILCAVQNDFTVTEALGLKLLNWKIGQEYPACLEIGGFHLTDP